MELLQSAGGAVERDGAAAEALPGIARDVEALEDVADRDRVGPERFVPQLAPGERHRDRRAAARADGVGGHGGLCVGVAVDVDEDAAPTLGLGEFERVAAGGAGGPEGGGA